MGRRGALGQPPTAWRERRREVIPWCTVHHSPPLETQRLRKLLFYWSFGYRWLLGQRRNKNKMKQRILHPALLRGREWCGHTRPWRRAGWGAAAGVEATAGFLQRMMCLIASVCFCAAENCWAQLSTASPKRPVCDTGAFRNCTFSFMSVRHSQRWRSWTTSVDIARPRDCAVTFVARSARSIAARSSCRTARSCPPSCRFLSALAWWTCSNAMACRAEAASPQAL